MKDLFEMASGSVPGRWHIEAGRNNQDAKVCICTDRVLVAVVTDGCSDGAFSEVGARVGASLAAVSLVNHAIRYDAVWRARLLRQPLKASLAAGGLADSARQASNVSAEEQIAFPYWEMVRQDVLAQIRILANAMGDNLRQVVLDHFLFTIVGALIAQWGTFVFSIGDGVYALNGQINQIGPFPGNEPPYIAYALVRSSLNDAGADALRFQVREALPTPQVTSLLVGTDGIMDFVNAAGERVPGKDRLIGPLSQFWEEDRCFTNADHVRRVLAGLNQTVKRPDWDSRGFIKDIGPLTDDTTLAAARRKIR